MGDDSWHPYFRALWEHSRALPDAQEDHPWGDAVFKVGGKIFVIMGDPATPRITVKAPPDELDVLLGVPFIERARYVGRYGWVTITVEDDEALSLARQLIDDSHELIRPRARARAGRR